jgi:hypothetical protein
VTTGAGGGVTTTCGFGLALQAPNATQIPAAIVLRIIFLNVFLNVVSLNAVLNVVNARSVLALSVFPSVVFNVFQRYSRSATFENAP